MRRWLTELFRRALCTSIETTHTHIVRTEAANIWRVNGRTSLTRRNANTRATDAADGVAEGCKRPEPDILPREPWKCSMRSAFYWFAEFCHSQCLSHFAASFIVTWAETSIAKSCKIFTNLLWWEKLKRLTVDWTQVKFYPILPIDRRSAHL